MAMVQHQHTPKWKKQDRIALEIEIIKELGQVPTVRKMQAELLKRTGHKWSTSVIHADLRSMDKITMERFETEKKDLLSKLNREIEIAHSIAVNEEEDSKIRLTAMKTMSVLAKAKSDLLEVIGKVTAEQNKKIIKYEIHLGEPKRADKNVKEDIGKNNVDTSSNEEGTV